MISSKDQRIWLTPCVINKTSITTVGLRFYVASDLSFPRSSDVLFISKYFASLCVRWPTFAVGIEVLCVSLKAFSSVKWNHERIALIISAFKQPRNLGVTWTMTDRFVALRGEFDFRCLPWFLVGLYLHLGPKFNSAFTSVSLWLQLAHFRTCHSIDWSTLMFLTSFYCI